MQNVLNALEMLAWVCVCVCVGVGGGGGGGVLACQLLLKPINTFVITSNDCT